MPTNRIQIKRSTANAAVTGLNPGELAFTANGNILYIGNPADGASVRIAGLQTPGTLTANQALVANATSGIDKVITANLVPTNIWANGAAGIAGQVLSSNSTGGVFWTSPTAGVAGSTTQVQFNDGGALAGDAGFVFDKTTDTLTVNGAFQTPGTGTGTGGTVQNTSTMFVGNNTVNTVITSAGLNVNAATIANSSGVYTTGTVNAASLTAGAVGTGTGGSVQNTTTMFVGNNTVNTVITSAGLNVNAATIANSSGVYTTGTVNAATVSVGSSIVANSSRLVIGTGVGVQANGGIGSSGQVLTSNGTTVFWAAPSTADITGVTAGDGLTGGGTANDVALAVGQGNGITVSADAVAVNAGNGLVANATGLHILTTGDATLIANATGLYVNDASLSIASSQITGDIALGTNTSGNYVATITAGAGISGASGTEGGTPTIAVVANNGIVANSTGVFVAGANGISVTTAGVNVLAGTAGGLVSNSTGVFITAGDGLVTNATGLHMPAGNGISVSADAHAVVGGSTLTVNTSGVHVNSTLSITDLTLSGNLTVLGDLVSMNVSSLAIEDPLITLAKDQATTATYTDALDIGFFGAFGNTANANYTGLFRDQSDSGVYKLFTGNIPLPGTFVDTANVNYRTSTLEAFLRSGGLVSNSTAVNITANSTLSVALVANTLTLTTPLIGTSGGTGKSTMTNNAILVGNSTNGYNELALNTNAGYVLQSNGTALVYDYLDGGTF